MAVVEAHTGLYQEYKNFHVFWPCEKNVPHFVELVPGINEEISEYLKNRKGLFARVRVELLEESKRGQDGTAIIHELIEGHHLVKC